MAAAASVRLLRGYAILFNVKDDRKATDRDIQNLRQTFNKINCECVDWSEEGIGKLREMKNEEWNKLLGDKYEYMIVVLMGHGTENGLVQVLDDGKTTLRNIFKVVSPLKKIEAMSGKLKWIISSACRGAPSTVESDSGKEYIIKTFASSEGQDACRNTITGSVYIQVLCRQLEMYAANESLKEIHKRCVTEVLAKTPNKQRPSFEESDPIDFSFTKGIR